MPQSPSDYLKAFERELEQLNPAQRTAVDQIDGPVMVLAGPGTGKTHLLAARIGNILLQTDARPNNILCLTYTEAGVKAMRQRLLKLIGPEAHRVHVQTFHGFCSMVIQDNLEYFGRPRLEPLSELERIRIIRGLLDELDVHHPLRIGRGDGYFYEEHLHWLFTNIKAEDWEPETLKTQIDAFVGGLADNPDYQYKVNRGAVKRGDPKVGAIETTQQRMAVLSAAVDLYPQYQAALLRAGRYDFADMIRWVLEGFREFPTLLRTYQERYLYLLVDEFQDTNGAQNEIVRLLADYWDRPNIFIVGDDDQSIYEFQGARLQSMIDFFGRYAEVKVVTLTENYRSKPAVLDAASELINHNEIRIQEQLTSIDVQKTLRPSHPEYGKRTDPIHVWEYADRDQETAAVLDQIRQWHTAGIPYAEMAVIYSRHKQAEALTQLLEASGIPYATRRPTNVLDDLPVRQVRQLLEYIHREQEQAYSGEPLLYRLLHFRCFDLDTRELAQLSMARAKGDIPKEDAYWRDLLQHSKRATPKMQAVGKWLEECIGASGSMPLSRLLEKVLNGSGLLAWVSRRADRGRQLAGLTTFLDFVRAEIIRRPRLKLAGLLSTLEGMDDNRVRLPLRTQLEQVDAITLVTAHSAKGLEFECVWLLDASDKEWNAQGNRGARHQFKLPPTLTLSGEADALEARRRLFFVAMTRAKSTLIISYARLNEQRKPQSAALFIAELLRAESSVSFEEQSLDADRLLAIVPLRLGATTGGEPAPVFEKAAIEELLNNYRLSVSGLNRYLRCPLAFFYETILRVPTFEREAATFGDALHEALQDYFLRMRADPQRIFPGKSELVYYFEQSMERRRNRFTATAYADRLQQGRRELSSYFDQYRSSWIPQSRVEQRIANAEVRGVPLTGIIDRVDYLTDTDIRIIDYKSGSQAADRLRAPTKAKPHGGSYWRQLLFYKLLFENRPGLPRRVVESAISFLVMNQRGEQPTVTVNIDRNKLERFTDLLEESWTNILAQEFTGCGEEDCEWCRFERENLRVVPAEDEEVRLLDDGV